MPAHEPLGDGYQSILFGRFHLLGLLSSATQTPVYLVSNEKERARLGSLKILTAAKVITDPPSYICDYLREEVLQSEKLRHPNVVSLYEFMHDGTLGILSMEYVQGLSFEDCAEKLYLSSYQVLHFAIQLFSALSFLHGNNIVHGRLDASHVLIRNDGTMKLLVWGSRLPSATLGQLDLEAASSLLLTLLAKESFLLEDGSGRLLRQKLISLLESFSDPQVTRSAYDCYRALIGIEEENSVQDMQPALISPALETIFHQTDKIKASQSITVVLILGCVVCIFLVLLAIFGEYSCTVFFDMGILKTKL